MRWDEMINDAATDNDDNDTDKHDYDDAEHMISRKR